MRMFLLSIRCYVDTRTIHDAQFLESLNDRGFLLQDLLNSAINGEWSQETSFIVLKTVFDVKV